jgi:hypothetical protein
MVSEALSPSKSPSHRERIMRRALVLTDEGARHPFRATLPSTLRRETIPAVRTTDWRLTASDVRGFATMYFASFACVLAFIV